MSCGVDGRHGSNPALLWLWRRPAATALIGPLAWEPPYAAGAALEKTKRQKKKVPRLGVKLELELLATAPRDLSPCRIFNSLHRKGTPPPATFLPEPQHLREFLLCTSRQEGNAQLSRAKHGPILQSLCNFSL